MAKILFISFLNEDIRSGYKEKIHSQAKAFSENGNESFLYIVRNNSLVLYNTTNEEKVLKEYDIKRKRITRERNIIDELLLMFDFYKNFKKVIKELNPDLIYIRRIVPINPFVIKIIKFLIKRNVYVVYEYPSFPWEKEMISNKQYFFYLLDKFYYKKLIKNVDLVTYIGDYDMKNEKFLRIINGVDIDLYKLKGNRNNNLDGINFLSVAHVANYHGYDRMILSMAEYYKKNPSVEITYNIVGSIDESLGLKELVLKHNLNDKIFFHGIKTGKQLDKIYEESDIGIDCLALYRKGISISSSLKSREYLARGMPFIYSGEVDFVKFSNIDFVYAVNGNDEIIDLEEVINFYNNIESSPTEIREFAFQHLSWKNIMSKVIKKFDSR